MRLTIFFKFIIFSILILCFDYQVVGQFPESMNYQAVIRDGSGNVLANQAVGLQIKILQGSSSGSSVYEETFAPTTNAYGSIAIQIGTGIVVSGTFNTIDWGGNTHFVETAVDIDGTANGTSYVVISTTQLMSVPYALYAKKAGNVVWSELSGNAYRTSGNIGIGTANPEWNLDIKTGTTTEGGIMQLSNSNEDHLLRVFSGSNSDPNPFLLWKTGDPLRFSTSSGLNDGSWQEHMRIKSNGNVGIGTTSPSAKLEVSGTARITDLAGTGDRMVVANADGDLSTQAIGTGPAGPAGADGAVGAIGPVGPAGADGSDATNYWTESGSDIYRSTGNVGIGTTSPAVKLEVNGQARITSLTNTSISSNRIVTASSDGTLGNGNSGYPLSSPSLSHTSTSSNRIVTASYDGNLGTGNSGYPLSSPSLAGTGDRMVVANANGDLSTQAIPSGSSSPWTESGSNIYRNSGNIGIGTTSPTATLDVNGTVKFSQGIIGAGCSGNTYSTALGYQSTAFSNYATAIGYQTNTGTGYATSIGYRTKAEGYGMALGFRAFAGSYEFAIGVSQNLSSATVPTAANNENVLTIKATGSGTPSASNRETTIVGKVGIGTNTSPAATLEVDGTTRITGLSGTGTRMVVADADGDLSTQAIGTGPAGADGATGPAGPAGADGAIGPAGPAGPSGADATNYWTETGSNIYRNSGNVGIGTTSPSAKLDVFGPVNVTGTVAVAGDVFGNTFYGTHNGPVIGDVFGIHNGPVTGDVTGNVTGDVTGNLVGNTSGIHNGPVTGNVTGDVFGIHNGLVIGDVFGDVFGNAATSTKLATAITIGGVSFDGSTAIDFIGTPPSSSNAAGAAGAVIIDDNYIYICTATNTWKRVAISTW